MYDLNVTIAVLLVCLFGCILFIFCILVSSRQKVDKLKKKRKLIGLLYYYFGLESNKYITKNSAKNQSGSDGLLNNLILYIKNPYFSLDSKLYLMQIIYKYNDKLLAETDLLEVDKHNKFENYYQSEQYKSIKSFSWQDILSVTDKDRQNLLIIFQNYMRFFKTDKLTQSAKKELSELYSACISEIQSWAELDKEMAKTLPIVNAINTQTAMQSMNSISTRNVISRH